MIKRLCRGIKCFFKNDDAETKVQWKLWGRVWREIGRPQMWGLIAGTLCMVLSAAAESWTIVVVKQIIDEGFIASHMKLLYVLGLQIIAAFGLKGAFGYISGLVMAKVGLNASKNLRMRVYKHMLTQDMSYFAKSDSGTIMNYFTAMSGAVLNLVTGSLVGIIRNVSTVIMTFAIMLYYAGPLCLVLVFLLPAIVVPMIMIMRKKVKIARNSFGVSASSNAWILQSIQGIRSIQSYVQENKARDMMLGIENNANHLAYKNTQLNNLQSPILEMMISVGLAIALVVGGTFIVNGTMTTGDFMAFLLALTAAYKPVKSVTSVGSTLQTGIIAAENLFKFLDQKPKFKDDPKKMKIDISNGMSVEFDDVKFRYDGTDKDVLKGINLTVNSGQTCALVGASGGGKTTIINLLERFYDVSSGSIKINGNDIRDYSLKSLRDNVSEVSQDVFLFNASIAENISFGRPSATMEEIIQAAKMANVDEFVSKMKEGYDTIVGERGVILSGGQKQRVAIARAMLKNAPLLLLDEATSALDTKSERMVQEAIEKLMKGRTVFVVAHRLSTIVNSDIICVIKDGQIIEQGTDDELMALSGEYKILKQMQVEKKKREEESV